VLVVHPSVPANTVKEFVDYARANPGKLNVANGGTGSSGHLNTAIFLNATKLKMEEIQYRGQPPAIIDLVAGRVQFALASPSLVVQYIQSGQLKALGVVARNRLPQLPNVPTMSEVGYPETNVVAWYGLCAPKDTPADIVEKIVSGVNEALKDPAVRTALESQMTQVMEPMTPAQLQALVASDTEKYAKIIKEANIKVQ
jgi:tripartite-type tricarboxylate transporter receptor subunit TctC